MIFDTFMYNGEESILDIRLNTLDPIVDKFIFIESPTSHSKIKKEPKFKNQEKRFLKFQNKIDYYCLDYCIYDNYHYNDFAGRKALQEILIKNYKVKSDDTIIHGDLDEIPRPETLIDELEKREKNDKPFTLMTDYRTLCFDLQDEERYQKGKEFYFPGSMVLKAKILSNNELHSLRQVRGNPIINGRDFKDTFDLIDHGGWHFTYCAGINETVDKFKHFCHADEMNGSIKDKDGLINCIKNKISFSPNKNALKIIEWKQENFPKYIFENKEIFKENLSFYF